MEDGELDVVGLGGVDQVLNHFGGLAQGLLAQDVEAVSQQILGDGVVQVGVGSVGDEVQLVLVSKQLGVVGQGLTAEDFAGSSCTVGVGFDDILDVADVIVLGTQESAVDVTAGTTKTDNSNVQLFHRVSLLLTVYSIIILPSELKIFNSTIYTGKVDFFGRIYNDYNICNVFLIIS